jgi:hypothetical protein
VRESYHRRDAAVDRRRRPDDPAGGTTASQAAAPEGIWNIAESERERPAGSVRFHDNPAAMSKNMLGPSTACPQESMFPRVPQL